MLVVEAAQPAQLVAARDPEVDELGQLDAPVEVIRPGRGQLPRLRPVAAGRTPGATRASRTGSSAPAVSATSNERSTSRLASSKRVRTAHPLGGLDRDATGEDGQPSERPALLLEQQLVAPVDGRLETFVARRARRAASGAAAGSGRAAGR